MRTWLRKTGMISLVVFLLGNLSHSLDAGPVMNVGPSDMVYQPTDEEGYMQAWNVNFRGNGMLIYITFVISNLGPKSLNNGVSILIVQKGKVRVWTKEYDYQSLEAQKSKVWLTNPKTKYKISFRHASWIQKFGKSNISNV